MPTRLRAVVLIPSTTPGSISCSQRSRGFWSSWKRSMRACASIRLSTTCASTRSYAASRSSSETAISLSSTYFFARSRRASSPSFCTRAIIPVTVVRASSRLVFRAPSHASIPTSFHIVRISLSGKVVKVSLNEPPRQRGRMGIMLPEFCNLREGLPES